MLSLLRIVPLLFLCTASWAGSSELYGLRGERWDPQGRLPDFSYAGYDGRGETPPDVAVAVNVKDFGAVGDGSTDDTAAFQAAIAHVEEGAILIPEGRYRVTSPLYIEKSNVVLRGSGQEASVLFFDASLREVYGENQVWSWNGGFIWVRPQSAPERLTALSANAERGAVTLEVETTEGLSAGQMVVLSLRDDGTTLAEAIHAGHSVGGNCSWQVPLTFDWPVQIQSVGEGTVTLAQPLRIPVSTEWAPQLETASFIHDVGVEDLTIQFPDDVDYPGHLQEWGYNGVFFVNGVVNSWVRRVRFEHSDNAVLTDINSKWLTISDIVFAGRMGHHGVNAAFTADSLFSNLYWEADFIHDFTLDHRSSGNVIERGNSAGMRLSLDHHRDGSFENLFTEFGAETDFWSGGSTCAGPNAGARQTFWNMAPGFLKPPWAYIQANIVGDIGNDAVYTETEEWLEPVVDLQPVNLYREQLAQRLGQPSTVEEETIEPSETEGCGCQSQGSHTWTWVLLGFVLFGLRRTSRQLDGEHVFD